MRAEDEAPDCPRVRRQLIEAALLSTLRPNHFFDAAPSSGRWMMPSNDQQRQPARTSFVTVSARQPFAAKLPNCGPAAARREDVPVVIYTSSRLFFDQFVARNPVVFDIVDRDHRHRCIPRSQWASTRWAGKRVLFLLASSMLGDNVGVFLFLQAFAERFADAQIGVACPGPASDIFLSDSRMTVHPLWISSAALQRYDAIVDVAHLEGWETIDQSPMDPEQGLLDAFGLSASSRHGSVARPVLPRGSGGRPRISIFPLASSPLRTLPLGLVRPLAEALSAQGPVTIHLNRYQRQGELYRAALAGRLPADVTVTPGHATIGELMRDIDLSDFCVFADSGPAHLSKLFAVPGATIYTAANGAVLAGRFRHQLLWQTDFSGPHCTAPCGLARLRQDRQGAIGCMGSLSKPLSELPDVARQPDRATVDRLLMEAPVPCVASLARNPAPVIEALCAALAAKLRDGDRAE